MLTNNEKLTILRRSILFDSLDDPTLEEVNSCLAEEIYRSGDVVFEAGSEGDSLYLVAGGGVRISRNTSTGGEIVIGTIHQGDFFGELDLIDERLRSARASAIGETLLLRFPKSKFRSLLSSNWGFALNVLRMLAFRLRMTSALYVYQEESNLDAIQSKLHKTHTLIEASKIVNSTIDTDELLELILRTATSIVKADRGTLYLVDTAGKELWSKVAEGSQHVELRLPMGKGIAGFVAVSGETINLRDVYNDPRFAPEVDRQTGYRTQTMLCMPMKNKSGQVIGVFQLLNKQGGVFTHEDEEILEGLSAHAALAIANAQMAQQMVQHERLSAVGRMANTIIHDIKNPMGVLRLSAQVMKKKSTSEETARLADEMVNQIDRFLNMTQEILEFSRGVSSLNIQTFDFREMVEAVLHFLESDLKHRNIRVIKNLRHDGLINADRDKVIRVIYNIANNAADAMPNGGDLTINAYCREDRLVMEFIDTGVGMPPEIRAKIFEPFVTFGKSHGTGLGMAIVKKIIDDHHGRIEIESEQGVGTTVRLLLPLENC